MAHHPTPHSPCGSHKDLFQGHRYDELQWLGGAAGGPGPEGQPGQPPSLSQAESADFAFWKLKHQTKASSAGRPSLVEGVQSGDHTKT